MTNLKMRNSPAYKTFLAYATGAIPPKKARKFKKPASPSKKKTLVIVEEPAEKPAKKPVARRQSAGVQIRDTPGVSVSKKKAPAKAERSKGIELLSKVALLEEAQLKKAIQRIKQETNIHQAGGSSEGAGLKPEVPDEPKGKSIDTSERTGLKLGVPDVSKADSSKSECESWGDSDDNDDDDQQSDDEQTESDNPRSSDDEEETQEDEFVHTPENYVPTDDESNDVDDEEYDRINKEMYSDVNVGLKDTELKGEGKDDEEMTDAGHVDDEHENVNQETSPLLTVPILVIPKSSITPATTIPLPIRPFIPLSQQLTPIPTPTTIEATTSTPAVQESETLNAIHLRVLDLEKEVKELKNVDHSSTLLATIKSEVPTAVKKLIKEHSVPADVVEGLKQQQKPQKSAEDIRKVKMEHATKQQECHYTITPSDKAALKEFDQKRNLFKTMTKSKSFDRNPKYRALYHALMKPILEDEDAMDKGV
ncbi:hypothetical protein Tco_0045932, partial [Tanacetum coccineum]